MSTLEGQSTTRGNLWLHSSPIQSDLDGMEHLLTLLGFSSNEAGVISILKDGDFSVGRGKTITTVGTNVLDMIQKQVDGSVKYGN